MQASCTSRQAASAERAARGDSEATKDGCGGADAGDGGLEQVGADERGEQQPPRGDEGDEQRADEGDGAGEGEHGAVEVHEGYGPFGVSGGGWGTPGVCVPHPVRGSAAEEPRQEAAVAGLA